MSYGMKGFIGLGKETAWGSGVAVTDYFYALNEDIKADLDRFDIRNIVDTVAEPDDDVGILRVAGSFLAGGHPVSIGHFLKGIMQQASGSVVTSGSLWKTDFTTSLNDFDAATTPVQPFTMEVARDTSSGSVQYTGCVFNTLEMAWAINQNVRCKVGVIGRDQNIIARTSATFPGSPTKDFKFSTTSLSVGGAGTARIESLNMTINNNLEGVPALNNSTAIAKIRRRNTQMVTLGGTIDFVDFAEYSAFLAQTEQRWFWNTTAANSFSLLVDLPRVVYTAFPLSTPGRERLTVGFNAKAFYSTGSATAAKISLTTVKSNY